MEQYDDTFETVDAPPTIKEIEKRLRKLGCTKEQVSRHLCPFARPSWNSSNRGQFIYAEGPQSLA